MRKENKIREIDLYILYTLYICVALNNIFAFPSCVHSEMERESGGTKWGNVIAPTAL